MIKPKKKICTTCGKETYIFSKGRCKNCAQRDYNKPTAEKIENSDFFKEFVKTAKPVCRESKRHIPNFSKFNCCHIFPKRRYKSVAHNPDNIIIYSFQKHTRFDELLDRMKIDEFIKEFPNSHKIVIEKVKKLIPLITEHGELKNKFQEFLAR